MGGKKYNIPFAGNFHLKLEKVKEKLILNLQITRHAFNINENYICIMKLSFYA